MRSLGFVGSAGGLVVRSGCLQRTCDLRRSSARPSRSGGAVRMDDFSMSSGQGEGSSEAESVVGVEAATEEERRILFSSAVSTKKRLSEALADAVDEAMFNLPIGCVPDLAIVYVSVAYEDRKVGLNRERLDSVVPQLRELVPGLKNIIGGTVAGVLGGDSTGACTEVEGRPAVSITFAQIPDAQIQVFHVDEGDLPSLDTSPDEWVSLVGGAKPHAKPSFILLCNSPFYSNGGLSHFVRGVDFAYPGSVKVGGVVGAPSPTPGIMYGTMKKDLLTLTSKAVFDGGVVGMTIAGGIEMETIVTQGVRGVGPVFSVRKVSQKSLLELELQTPNVPGQVMPTDRALKLVVRHASKEDQGLLFKNPLLGVADDEFKDDLRNGDYLCRQLQGIDPRTGGVAMADTLRPGQRVRFHVRDSNAALHELGSLLNRFKRDELNKTISGTLKPIVGTLTFTDVSRGVSFFREQNVDSTTFAEYAPAPLAGFFAQAEIAPIGGKRSPTHTHESAAVFTIIREANPRRDVEDLEEDEAALKDEL